MIVKSEREVAPFLDGGKGESLGDLTYKHIPKIIFAMHFDISWCELKIPNENN